MRRLLLVLIACATWPLRAQMDMQHPMQMDAGPLGIPESRMGSGTSWLPDASSMHATRIPLGDWTLMLHGQGFVQYDRQGGSRGSDQLGVINWAMAAASRRSDRSHSRTGPRPPMIHWPRLPTTGRMARTSRSGS